MAKLNNNRKHPDGSSPRPDLSNIKREEAKERQAHYDSLSVEQKIEALDKKLGVGLGASKQRVMYAAMLSGSKNVPVVVENVVEEISMLEQENTTKKHLKAKDRRKMERDGGDEYEDKT